MIIIDYNDKRPIYEQIVDRIQNLILSGALAPDTKMPSVRALAVELSINPNTIQRAYAELERNGFLYTVKGRGNFVRTNEDQKLLQREMLLRHLEDEAKNCLALGVDKETLKMRMLKLLDNYETGGTAS